jgi:hypothetical protein
MEAGEWMVRRRAFCPFELELTSNFQLCRELLRFLYSLDRSGMILRAALSEGMAAFLYSLRPF